MTRLAFLIGFAIGFWWVLRERRDSLCPTCYRGVEHDPSRCRDAFCIHPHDNGLIWTTGGLGWTGEPIDPPDPYLSSLYGNDEGRMPPDPRIIE